MPSFSLSFAHSPFSSPFGSLFPDHFLFTLTLPLIIRHVLSFSFSMLCHSHTFLLTPSVHFTLWLYFILPLTPPFTNFLSLNFAFYIFLSLSLEISLSLILSISFPLSFSVSFSLPPYTLCSVYRSRSYFSHSLCRAFFFLFVFSLSQSLTAPHSEFLYVHVVCFSLVLSLVASLSPPPFVLLSP